MNDRTKDGTDPMPDPRDKLSDTELAMTMADAHAFTDDELQLADSTERPFEDALLAHLEWKKYNPELNYLVWHGASSYFPLKGEKVIYANFPDKEATLGDVACNCGCGQEYLNLDLYNRLTHARVLAGVPFYILSWNRCPVHNKAEGGSDTSSHLEGYAVDIRCWNSEVRFKILKALLDVGFTRIGIYEWGIHVDVDPDKPAGLCWHV